MYYIVVYENEDIGLEVFLPVGIKTFYKMPDIYQYLHHSVHGHCAVHCGTAHLALRHNIFPKTKILRLLMIDIIMNMLPELDYNTIVKSGNFKEWNEIITEADKL